MAGAPRVAAARPVPRVAGVEGDRRSHSLRGTPLPLVPPQEAARVPREPTIDAAARSDSPARAASPAEVLQRVEAWVAAGTPRLQLDLGGTLAGRVELSRSGPGRVRVSWRCGRRGTAGLAARLHAALTAQGLSVEALEIRAQG